jgi:hypothetical protein
MRSHNFRMVTLSTPLFLAGQYLQNIVLWHILRLEKNFFAYSRNIAPSTMADDFNPILHTAWLDNHALTLKSNSAKYYFHDFCILF